VTPLVVNTEMPSVRGRASLFVDTVRPLNENSAYYLLLFDSHHQDKVIACAPLLRQRPKQATALFKGSSVQGKRTNRFLTLSVTFAGRFVRTQDEFGLAQSARFGSFSISAALSPPPDLTS
jgi:hypothetical protein